jgi:hypothetical protein
MLTEKGKYILELIFSNYKELEKFTCKELSERIGEKVAGAILTGIIKDGYLSKDGSSPVNYWLKTGSVQEYSLRQPKKFNTYSLQEFYSQEKFSYKELCEILTKKYGIVDGNYFNTEECKSTNSKIKRGKEGLFIHHIQEKNHIMLCDSEYAKKLPFDYQKGYNLVYCNIFEHLLLHMKIVQECIPKKGGEVPGLGGVVNLIGPQISYRYAKGEIKIENIVKKDFEKIMNNFFKNYNTYLMSNYISQKEIKKMYQNAADKMLIFSLLK